MNILEAWSLSLSLSLPFPLSLVFCCSWLAPELFRVKAASRRTGPKRVGVSSPSLPGPRPPWSRPSPRTRVTTRHRFLAVVADSVVPGLALASLIVRRSRRTSSLHKLVLHKLPLPSLW